MSMNHNYVNPNQRLQSPISDKENNRQRLASLEKYVQLGLQPCSFQAVGVHKFVAHSSPHALQPRQGDVRTWQ